MRSPSQLSRPAATVVAYSLAAALRQLWSARVLGGVGQSLAGSAGALLAGRLGGSDTAAGLPQAALVLGSAVSALALSWLTRRAGRRRALAVGAMTAAAGAGLVAAAGLASVAMVLAGSVLLGAGATSVSLGRYAAADLATEGGRARAMATVLAATTVGAVAGPNLLASTDDWGRAAGLPDLAGPYLGAGIMFAGAAATLFHGHVQRPSTARSPVAGGAAEADTAAPRSKWTRRGLAGLVVLSAANLVMVAVMTMAPVQLHHVGSGLAVIGLVVSVHIAGMYAPSPVSGWLTDRLGAPVTATIGALTLASGCVAAVLAGSDLGLGAAMLLLGTGWNLALLSGSALLTSDIEIVHRPAREGWGETTMGAAAAGGGLASGMVMTAGGYSLLAGCGTAVSVVVAFAAVGGIASDHTSSSRMMKGSRW